MLRWDILPQITPNKVVVDEDKLTNNLRIKLVPAFSQKVKFYNCIYQHALPSLANNESYNLHKHRESGGPPEKHAYQLENDKELIWNLGAMFFYILTGSPPFQFNKAMDLSWEYNDLVSSEQDVLDPFDEKYLAYDVNDQVPEIMRNIIKLCMSKQKEKRPNFKLLTEMLQELKVKQGSGNK